MGRVCLQHLLRTTLKETPFCVIYGHDPPALREYDVGDCRVPTFMQTMTESEEFLGDIRAWLEQSQTVAKHAYDRGLMALTFSP